MEDGRRVQAWTRWRTDSSDGNGRCGNEDNRGCWFGIEVGSDGCTEAGQRIKDECGAVKYQSGWALEVHSPFILANRSKSRSLSWRKLDKLKLHVLVLEQILSGVIFIDPAFHSSSKIHHFILRFSTGCNHGIDLRTMRNPTLLLLPFEL